jgi:hypothetical protein
VRQAQRLVYFWPCLPLKNPCSTRATCRHSTTANPCQEALPQKVKEKPNCIQLYKAQPDSLSRFKSPVWPFINGPHRASTFQQTTLKFIIALRSRLHFLNLVDTHDFHVSQASDASTRVPWQRRRFDRSDICTVPSQSRLLSWHLLPQRRRPSRRQRTTTINAKERRETLGECV